MDKPNNSARIAEAEMLLRSEVLRTVLEGAEAEIVREWASGVANTVEKRESSFYAVQAVKGVRHRIEKMIESARFEAAQTAKKNTK
jgi:hypothetical protein